MPFIISRTNRSISREQELMLGFEDNYHLWLRGDNSQPMVYVEAAIWGNEAHLGYEWLGKTLTGMNIYRT